MEKVSPFVRSLVLGLVGASLFAWLSMACWAGTAWAASTVLFKACDLIHLSYIGSSQHKVYVPESGYETERATLLELVWEKPDGTKEVLTTGVQEGEYLVIDHGFLQMRDMALGDHKLYLRETYRVWVDPPGEIALSTYTHSGETITRGEQPELWGTPQQDETISGWGNLNLGHLTVKAGQHLTLTGLTEREVAIVQTSNSITLLEGEGTARVTIQDCDFYNAISVSGGSLSYQQGDGPPVGDAYLSGNVWRRPDFSPGLYVSGLASARVENCESGAFYIGGLDLVVTGNLALAEAEFFVVGDLELSDCEFFKTCNLSMSGDGSPHGTLTDNVFHGRVKLGWPSTQSQPWTITGNSFLGEKAMELFDDDQQMTLAGNFWGGPKGPIGGMSGGTGDSAGYLTAHGGLVGNNILVESPSSTGTMSLDTPEGKPPLPKVWLDHMRLSGNGRKGTDHLFSFVPYCDVESLDGVVYTLEVDGVEVPQENPSFVTKRDYGLMDMGPDNADRTVNFIIPADKMNKASVRLQVFVDTTGLTEYADAGAKESVYDHTHSPLSDYGETWYIGLMPIHLNVDGYAPDRPPRNAVKRMTNELVKQLKNLYPLKAGDFKVIPISEYTYSGGYMGRWVASKVTKNMLLKNLGFELKAFRNFYNVDAPEKIQTLVAIMPSASVSKADGASVYWRRDIAFVDESSPSAVGHEVAHSLGLWTTYEQYSWTASMLPGSTTVYEAGQRAQNVTGFSVTGDMFNALPERIRHFPADGTADVWDMMGCKNNFWVIPDTSSSLQYKLRLKLGTASSPRAASTAEEADVPQSAPDEGWKRLMLTGILRFNGTAWRLMTDSISSRDVSATAQDTYAGPKNLSYYLRAFRADGAGVGSTYAKMEDPGDDPPVEGDEIPWVQSLDVLDNVRRVEVYDYNSGEVVWYQDITPGLTTAITGISPGDTIGDTLTIGVQASDPPVGRTLYHQLFYSADSGASWLRASGFFTGNSLSLPSDFLPQTSSLSLLLVTTDGVGSATDRVDGLIVGNRAPSVTIEAPMTGDTAPPDHAWSLVASVYDAEDSEAGTVAWTSSRDGALGSGAYLSGVALSAGTHTITCTVTDSQGATGTATATVNVAAGMTTVDLSLGEDALGVSIPGRDPMVGAPTRLEAGVEHSLSLTARNQGLAGSVRLSLYVTAPGQGEALLASQDLVWAAFGTQSVSASYTPSLEGDYVFRGVVESLDPGDGNAGNNSRSWTWPLGNQAPSAYCYTQQVESQVATAVPLSADDPEGASLTYTILTQPAHGTLGGTAPDMTYTSGAYTGSDTFTFKVNDGSLDSETATVTLDVTPNTTADTDGDGILDVVEIASGCRKADDGDTDDDGINDGVEDANHDGLVQAGETDPCNPDTDGDGIQDGTESGYAWWDADPDTDTNVFVPDEAWWNQTDPTDTDSDGDGVADGWEDTNHNGRVDEGEWDPDDAGDHPPAQNVTGRVLNFGNPATSASILVNGMAYLPDQNGDYTVTAAYGSSLTLTPSMWGLPFHPPNRTMGPMTAGAANQDFWVAYFRVTLPTGATEGETGLSGTVEIPTTLESDLAVGLASDLPGRVSPAVATVTIPAGQTLASFGLTVTDDSEENGDQEATITASATGWADSTAAITVADNDVPVLNGLSVVNVILGRDDTDNDGIPDSIENSTCTSATNPDSDGDGIPDGVEDANRDGVRDAGESNPCSDDSDGDGLKDNEEDTNQNGQKDAGETDANNADTDGDGMPDKYEKDNGLDPLVNDAALDKDGDGFNNLSEYRAGTLPNDASSCPSRGQGHLLPLILN